MSLNIISNPATSLRNHSIKGIKITILIPQYDPAVTTSRGQSCVINTKAIYDFAVAKQSHNANTIAIPDIYGPVISSTVKK